MDLQTIVERYAECLEYVDAHTTTTRTNQRSRRRYLPGLLSLGEKVALSEVDQAWEALYTNELVTPSNPPRSRREPGRVAFPYPNVPRTTCDHVFSTDQVARPEWAVETKFISFFGDNGGNNDYGVSKMLSPYLKDRGLLHDAARLRESDFTRHVAVVMYAFHYSSRSCSVADRCFPQYAERISRVRGVVTKNGGSLNANQLVEIVDAVLTLRGYLRGPRVQADFRAWRHPIGGRGTVYGWEIRRSQLEPGFSHHPW